MGGKLIGELVINFMCQLEWATRCPDKTSFFSVLMPVFLDEVSILISEFNKVDFPPQCG